MKALNKLTLLALGLALFTTACQKDNLVDEQATLEAEGLAEVPGVNPLNGAWVLTGQQSSWAGGYYPFASLSNPLVWPTSGSAYSAYAVGGRSLAGYFWTLGNVTTAAGTRGIHRFSASTTSIPVPATFKAIGPGTTTLVNQQDEINFHIFDSSIGYYTDVEFEPGKITRFNPSSSTLADIGTWDLTAALAANSTLSGAGYNSATYKHLGGKFLIRRGNVLYADVTFGNGYNALKQIQQSTNSVYVAAINTNTGNLITVSSFAGARNIGLFNDHPLYNQDPVSNHIYFATVSDMDLQQTPSRILRINNGSNSINTGWSRNFQSLGGNNRISEFNTLYAYNDFLYFKYPTRNAKYTDMGHGVSYREPIWQWTVINPSGSIRRLDIPNDDFYAYQQPRLINGEIYFIYNNTSTNTAGIHKRVPVTNSTWSSSNPISTTTVTTYNSTSGIIRIAGLDRL